MNLQFNYRDLRVRLKLDNRVCHISRYDDFGSTFLLEALEEYAEVGNLDLRYYDKSNHKNIAVEHHSWTEETLVVVDSWDLWGTKEVHERLLNTKAEILVFARYFDYGRDAQIDADCYGIEWNSAEIVVSKVNPLAYFRR